MALKLLTPTEAQGRSKKSLESEKHRLVEVQTLITQKYMELSQAEADFDAVLQKNRNIWTAEQQEHQNKILALKGEVDVLEERKRQALIPIEERAKMLDTRDSVLSEREDNVSKKEVEVEETKTLLTSKLDEVSEREMQASKLAQTLSIQEQGVRKQAAEVKSNSTKLTVAITEAQKELSQKETELATDRARVRAKELHLEERERLVNVKEAGFDNREKAIQDKRATLERVIQEIKQKYGVHTLNL